jgi:hypothetical protein
MSDNKEDLVFAEGVFFSKPKAGAPKSIKAKIGIDVQKFLKFAPKYEKQNGYIDLDVRWSEQKAKFYITVNTFQPKPKADTMDGVPEVQLERADAF